jgi:hypothetical protein
MTLKSPRSNIMRSNPVEIERGTDQSGTIFSMRLLLDVSWFLSLRGGSRALGGAEVHPAPLAEVPSFGA